MKTSNKIILSFLIFTWLSFVATLLISHRFANYENIPGIRKVNTTEKSIGEFSMVKIDETTQI